MNFLIHNLCLFLESLLYYFVNTYTQQDCGPNIQTHNNRLKAIMKSIVIIA